MARLDIPEEAIPVRILEPGADAAGRTGDWIKLNNAGRFYIIAFVTQGNAATILLTVLQATAAAGTGSKVLTNVVPIWVVDDANTTDVYVRQTDAKNYTTSAGTTHKLVVFQIDAANALDQFNNFNWVTLSTGASNVANITSAFGIATDLRFAQPTNPTMIA